MSEPITSAAETAPRASVRVLLVDDVPTSREAVRSALAQAGGFDVVGESACDDTAVSLARDLAPDVVVLDLGLPELGGRELLLRVQEHAPTAGVVIVSSPDADHDASAFSDTAHDLSRDAEVEHLVDVLRRAAGATEGPSSLALPCDLAEVGQARSFVRDRLLEWQLPHLVDIAHLVVSELAANAVNHAHSDYEVSVSRDASSVRIAVRDHGPGMPAPAVQEIGSEDGRGLLLVSAMAQAGGVEPRTGGKIVWADLRQ